MKSKSSLSKIALLALALVSSNATASADDWGYEGVAPPVVKPPVRKTTIIPPVIVEEKEEEQSAAPLAKSLRPGVVAGPGKTLPGVKAGTGKVGAGKVGAGNSAAGNSGSVKAGAGRPVTGKAATGKAAGGSSSENSSAMSGSRPNEEMEDTYQAPAPIIAHPKAVKPVASQNSTALEGIVDKNQQAARCWAQLFQACNKQSMDYVAQKRIEAFELGKARAGGKHAEEVLSILKFWPKLMQALRNQPEMEMHYADLFRALMRLREKTGSEKIEVEGSPYTSDSDLISEVLGLERVAVPGNPSFTEDAVNAYADMAIFIYEQKHAGRTIDGPDNRSMFAKVVVEKFNTAPTDADKRAMASFDLAWTKFKIIWFESDSETKKVLLDKLVGKGAASALTVTKDPLLETVLTNWPWKTMP